MRSRGTFRVERTRLSQLLLGLGLRPNPFLGLQPVVEPRMMLLEQIPYEPLLFLPTQIRVFPEHEVGCGVVPIPTPLIGLKDDENEVSELIRAVVVDLLLPFCLLRH